MRNAFANALVNAAKKDPKLVFLTADIGNRLFDPFKLLFKGRFINCGVAEANMVSVAAGLALMGLKPIIYTIAPFLVYRALEQIRVDICMHNLSVLIVGAGAGLSYASLGPTHHSCEDIAVLRSLPNLKIVCPADSLELEALFPKILKQDGPFYFRIGKKNEPLAYQQVPSVEIGKGVCFAKGKEVCLFSTGNTLFLAKEIKESLEAYGINLQIISLHTIKPLDELLLKEICTKFPFLFSLEEHSIIGGLGGSISHWLTENQKKNFFKSFATDDCFYHKSYDQKELRIKAGLDVESMTKKILEKVSHAYRY